MFFDGYKYFVIFIDDYSQFTWLIFLNKKNKVATIFQNFCNLVKTQFTSTINASNICYTS
jgi:hypothetical protein